MNLALLLLLITEAAAFGSHRRFSDATTRAKTTALRVVVAPDESTASTTTTNPPRRLFLQSAALLGSSLLTTTTTPAVAAEDTATAEVTDKIYITIKGLPPGVDGVPAPNRIVIGLFGKNAPACTQQLKQLVSPAGLSIACRPRAERMLQKEQLEANKVYNGCMEGEKEGVTLRYSTIWRILANNRIDVGAVTGKYIAREYPTWSDNNDLQHDAPGVVSVRRGKEGGFGFTIYLGGIDDNAADLQDLNDNNIVIGRVLEGMDVVEALNQVPVVTSAKGLNYKVFGGNSGTSASAPTRSCRYGGPLYCNEYKPLMKLTVTDAGIVG